MLFGLNNEELEYLKQCKEELKSAIEKEDYHTLQNEMYFYLEEDDCMYYDEDDENWYTEKGCYIQSLYDKIINWYEETYESL